MSVAQGTKTFDEWLATDGKGFANDSVAMQKGIYGEYIRRKIREAGFTDDEGLAFVDIINEKNN